MVGSDGAELFYYGCTVSIPSGALEEDTEISLEFISTDLHVVSPDDLHVVSPILKLEPSNVIFHHPVTVDLPVVVYPSPTIPEAEWPELVLMCYENGKWSYKQSTKFKFRDLKFECNHFSRYYFAINRNRKRKFVKRLACLLYQGAPQGNQAEVMVCICEELPPVVKV